MSNITTPEKASLTENVASIEDEFSKLPPTERLEAVKAKQGLQFEDLSDGLVSSQHDAFVKKDTCIKIVNDAVSQKKFEATKNLIKTFHQKMVEYPKHMSYDGSMVICVLLSMKTVAAVRMENIPTVDQNLIKGLMPAETDISSFDVKFDDNKDFILIFNPNDKAPLTLTLFNTVAHPRPEDLIVKPDVQVKSDGDKIEVGGKIKMNRSTIEKMFGQEHQDSQPEREEIYQKKAVSPNRNAYEIRADVLKMAIDWASLEEKNIAYKKPSDELLLSLAKKFYSFVENRR